MLKVAVVQRFCAPYRIPVFRALASRPGIDLTLFYGRGANGGQWQQASVDTGVSSVRLFTLSARFGLDERHYLLAVHPGLLRRLAGGAFDVVLAEGTTNILDNVGLVAWCRLSGTPLVFWDSGRPPSEPKRLGRRIIDPLARCLLRRADAVVTYGRSTVLYFERIGLEPGAVFVAPNTVDLRPLEVEHDAWEGRKEELTALKQGLNLEGRRVLLHIGSLQKGKPLDSLMDAYEELSTVSGALGMIVIGDGDDRTRLEKVVGDRALEGVRFLGRQISGLAKYALISDVAVFPHGATLGIITTLALGLPVVAACGRSPEHEAIVEGVNGSLAALGDTADLARTLGDILSGRVRFASSQQIRAMVHRDFSLHRMVDGLESALRYAVATKATSVPSMDKQMRGPK